MAEQKNGEEMVMALSLGGIVVIGILVIVWVIFHTQISQLIVWTRQGQMAVASHWVEDNYHLNAQPTKDMADLVQRHGGKIKDPRFFEEWQRYLPNAQASRFKFKDFSYVSALALEPYKYIVAAIFILFAAINYQWGRRGLFRRKLGREELIKDQSKEFPHVKPFIRFNPAEANSRVPGDPVPSELPIFAEALAPEEWIAYNRIPLPDDNLDKDMARRAFEKQLGQRFRGPKRLKDYEQVLLASFCMKASRKREEADELLGRLAACWSHDKGLNLSLDKSVMRDTLKVLRSKALSESTFKVMRQHAFTTTALMRGLDYARSEGGILAPALFLWLRGHDRSLWYALNNLGKQAFHTEALGAVAHYKHEKRSARPIPIPKVDDAVQSLIDLLNSDNARPVPELDFSGQKNAKKRGGVLKPMGSE